MKRFLILFATSLATASTISSCASENRHYKRIFDYVLDAGTYTSLDYKFAEDFFSENNDDWGGNCSAVAKLINTSEGGQDMIIGRNMDLTLSNKSAYIIRTAVPGKKKTVGLAYSHRDYSPDYKEMLDQGFTTTVAFDKVLPFAMDDILNEDGLYIEVNMRSFEKRPDGSPKFRCSGTNPGKQRVYVFTIARYLEENCSTVDEAIKYLNNFDVYSSNKLEESWNYSYMIADASGNRKVIEFIDNEVRVADSYYNVNFWLDPTARAIEDYQCGLGREAYIQEQINSIDSESKMQQLMYDLSYFSSYDKESCKYETCTESVGDEPEWTTEYVLSHPDEIYDANYEDLKWMEEVGMDKVRDANYIWYSILSSVVNLNKKTFRTTFYEDKSKIIDIDMNGYHIVNE